MDFEERIDGIKLIVETVRTHVKPLPAAPKAKAAAARHRKEVTLPAGGPRRPVRGRGPRHAALRRPREH